ncbi:hypothetical protein BGX38DRAFT_1176667 [Terfezia claveryi]|nr:hypothetical protein BGX38DRAFT_1176667 [Terfezia claveryi]
MGLRYYSPGIIIRYMLDGDALRINSFRKLSRSSMRNLRFIWIRSKDSQGSTQSH